MIAIGEKNWFASRKNVINAPSVMSPLNTRQPPNMSRVATKNWLFSSSSGMRIAEVRASAMLKREWS